MIGCDAEASATSQPQPICPGKLERSVAIAGDVQLKSS